VQAHLAAGYRRNGTDQVGGDDVLQHVAERTRAQDFLDLAILRIARQHGHLRRGILRADRPDRVRRGQTRHLEVHQHDVGSRPGRKLERLVAVARFADDLQAFALSTMTIPRSTSIDASRVRARTSGDATVDQNVAFPTLATSDAPIERFTESSSIARAKPVPAGAASRREHEDGNLCVQQL